MVQKLCGADLTKRQDFLFMAITGFEKRVGLWDAIEQLLVGELV